jgi:adenylosuccinate lyase
LVRSIATVILPNAFLAADEPLRVVTRLVRDLQINEAAVGLTLRTYGPLAKIEPLLMRLVGAGADRQVMHEVLRGPAMRARAEVEAGRPNPLMESLSSDERLLAYVPGDAIRAALDTRCHIGDAPERALALVDAVREAIR